VVAASARGGEGARRRRGERRQIEDDLAADAQPLARRAEDAELRRACDQAGDRGRGLGDDP
jgi:hypothetical protein